MLVDAPDTAKIQLVLDGVTLHSESYAPIYIREADKVFVTLAPDSGNSLSNSGTYTQLDDHNVDAPLFCRSDLTLNGTGSLTVESPGGHGIVCKDELAVTGGTYTITAASHGLSANDGVCIGAGTFTITSGKDGIQSEHNEDTSLGYVYLEAGTYQLNTGDDAIHADNALTIQDGDISIPQCYEGLEGLTVTVAAWAVHSPAHHRTAPSDFSQTPTSGMPGVGVCVALFPAIVYNRVLIIRIGGSSLVGYHPSSFHSQPYPDQRSCGAPTVRSLCR